MKKKFTLLCLALISAVIVTGFSSCSVVRQGKYSGPFSEVNGAYAAVDDLGRVLTTDAEKPAEDKVVGIFYFLWQGEHGTAGPYDNEKIVANFPNAISSETAWLAAGGGAVGAHSFWGEPLFGYYTSRDKWVMRKHCQMLTDSGVDFILLDCTNAFTYTERVFDLIDVWADYLEQGFDVPKIAFYTNSSSTDTMNRIYEEIYRSSYLTAIYENIGDLWFEWDGKPMIVGTNPSPQVSAYFTVKTSQWPNAARVDNGLPWMEFSRSLTPDAVYGVNGRKEVINVSIAQHSATIKFSDTAWYGGNDRTRSWHDGSNDTSEDAILYGYNFAEQWEFALEQDTEMIFVTGWNEWVAQRQPAGYDRSMGPIVFVDCADPNTSRDAEPTTGEMGDNYYMQMTDYINQYKGSEYRVYVGDSVTVDVTGGFEQWDSADITAKYVDYTSDAVRRTTQGFGSVRFRDLTGRNDLYNMKVARDSENLYFYADTSSNIVFTGGKPMTLYLNTGLGTNSAWYGYDYRVNITAEAATLEKYNGTAWEQVSEVAFKLEGKQVMLSLSRSQLGIGPSVNDDVLDLQFKWVDNCEEDIWSFYQNGDCAPLGRMNYVFSEK